MNLFFDLSLGVPFDPDDKHDAGVGKPSPHFMAFQQMVLNEIWQVTTFGSVVRFQRDGSSYAVREIFTNHQGSRLLDYGSLN